jgi:hypothetical protein
MKNEKPGEELGFFFPGRVNFPAPWYFPNPVG